MTAVGALVRQAQKRLSSSVTATSTIDRYFPGTNLYLAINGVERATSRASTDVSIILESLYIMESRNLKTPNRASFTVKGNLVPADGDAVAIRFGNPANEERLFLGTIIDVDQGYTGTPENADFYVECIDNTRLMDQVPIIRSYPAGTDINVIIEELMDDFAPDITTNGVQAGLGTLDEEITFTNTYLTDALVQLAARCEAQAYLDPRGTHGDLHFYQTETLNPLYVPATLVAGWTDLTGAVNALMNAVKVKRSGAGRVSRVSFEGGGANTLAEVTVGDTTIPVEDTFWYQISGGRVRTGTQLIDYTGIVDGSAGSTVSGITQGSTPPTAASATNQDGRLGVGAAYSYKVSFLGAPGESEVSAASNSVTLSAVAAPGAPTVAVASGVVGLVTPGAHTYKISFVNANGETLPGTASASVTSVAFAAPTGAIINAGSSVGRLVGVFNYKVTYVTSLGETTGGSAFFRTAVAVAAPGAPSLAAHATFGKVIGDYRWRVTFVTPYGETTGGTVAQRTVNAITIPGTPTVNAFSSTMGNLIGTYNYRTTFVGADGIESASSSSGSRAFSAQGAPSAPSSISSSNPGPLIGSYNWKVAFVAEDGRETLGSAGGLSISAAPAPSAPSLSSSGAATISYRVSFFHPIWGETPWSSAATDASSSGTVDVTVSGLPSGCGYKVYSTGTGHPSTDPYFHVATVHPGGSNTYTHAGASGPEASSPGSTMGSTASMTIPTGPSGTVARRIYRTRAGGSTYFLCGEVGDNSTTSFSDTVPDESLSQGAPTQNLNGEMGNITNISTGPTGTVKRRLYRTTSGGSTLYLLTEILDNSTTSYSDNRKDAELNHSIQIPVAAGIGEQVVLSSIPLGPTGTLARRIYRTKAGETSGPYYLLQELPDNSTTSYTDNKTDAQLANTTAPLVNTAGGDQHAITSIPTGPTGTISRKIYRTTAGGSSYYLLTVLQDNVSTSFTDNIVDAELGDGIPLVNTAGANKIALTSIPLGLSGTTKRRIYRTLAGGTDYYLVGTLNDNTTTTFTDNSSDDEIVSSTTPLTVSTADGGKINLTSIPTGPVGTTKRRLYRTVLGGSIYYFLTEVNGNVTTTHTDNLPDSSLGAEAPSGSTWGAVSSQTELRVADLTNFPDNGWVKSGSQIVKYAAKSAPAGEGNLTGIPASGVGAIVASIPVLTPVVVAPQLTGIAGSGAFSVQNLIATGQPVNLFVTVDDVPTQDEFEATFGANYRIREVILSDNRYGHEEALARATAYMNLKKDPDTTVYWKSKDRNTRAGRVITAQLTAMSVSQDFKIQSVKISNFTPALAPDFEAVGSNSLFTLPELLRLARDAQGGR